jgi:hypothetical protein
LRRLFTFYTRHVRMVMRERFGVEGTGISYCKASLFWYVKGSLRRIALLYPLMNGVEKVSIAER